MAEGKRSDGRKVLGVLGGMGPLASAKFLKTIYERNLGACEQGAPAVLLYSDPTFPDRTDVLPRGEAQPLLDRLSAALRFLNELGCTKIIICCITSHLLLPRLPAACAEAVIPLTDVIYDRLLRERQRHLPVGTEGTRRLELFQRHPASDSTREYVVIPDEADRHAIHEMIYALKRNAEVGEMARRLKVILPKYGGTGSSPVARRYISWRRASPPSAASWARTAASTRSASSPRTLPGASTPSRT